MKPSRPIVLLLSAVWLLTLAACGPTAFRTRLAGADSLLCQHPDSALHVLRSWEAEASRARKSDRMYWRLLLADAENKCYVDQTSDSAMKAVADYYDSHGTANEQVRAHYLLGCAYRDMSDAPQALQCYQDAVDRADTTSKDCDYRLLMAVYGQMAELFHAQNLPHDETRCVDLYVRCAMILNDTLEYINGKSLYVRPLFLMGDTQQMIDVIESIRQQYSDLGFPQRGAGWCATLAYEYIKQGKLHKAYDLLTIFENVPGRFDSDGNITENREAYYYIKGDYYLATNQLDSAEKYFRHLLPFEEYHANAYRGLLHIFEEKHQADSVIYYALLFENATDSLNNRKRTETIHQMSRLYDYQRYQREANSKALQSERQKRFIIIILLIVVVSVAVLTHVYMQYRRRIHERFETLKRDFEHVLTEYTKVNDDFEKLKNNDKKLLESKRQEITVLKVQLRESRANLLHTKRDVKLTELKESKIVLLFKSKASGKKDISLPTEKEWDALIKQFARSLPVSYTNIGRDTILSRQEMKICILTLLGFPNGEASILMNVTPQYVTNLKVRINMKLFDESSAQTLLRNLCSAVEAPKNI